MPCNTKGFKIYKTKPTGKGWVLTNPIETAKRARTLVKKGYGNGILMRAVKTGPSRGKKKMKYPYSVYTKRR